MACLWWFDLFPHVFVVIPPFSPVFPLVFPRFSPVFPVVFAVSTGRGHRPHLLHAAERDHRGHDAGDLGGAHGGGELLRGGEEGPGGRREEDGKEDGLGKKVETWLGGLG